VGACACSDGIFGNNYATTGGIDNIVPVNVYIPGFQDHKPCFMAY